MYVGSPSRLFLCGLGHPKFLVLFCFVFPNEVVWISLQQVASPDFGVISKVSLLLTGSDSSQ